MDVFANSDKSDSLLDSNEIDLLSLKMKTLLLICLSSLFNSQSTPVKCFHKEQCTVRYVWMPNYTAEEKCFEYSRIKVVVIKADFTNEVL